MDIVQSVTLAGACYLPTMKICVYAAFLSSIFFLYNLELLVSHLASVLKWIGFSVWITRKSPHVLSPTTTCTTGLGHVRCRVVTRLFSAGRVRVFRTVSIIVSTIKRAPLFLPARVCRAREQDGWMDVGCRHRVYSHQMPAPRHDSIKQPVLCAESEMGDGRWERACCSGPRLEAPQQLTGDGWLGGRERHA